MTTLPEVAGIRVVSWADERDATRYQAWVTWADGTETTGRATSSDVAVAQAIEARRRTG